MIVRPIIFLDVDGPLIPFRERPGPPPIASFADSSGHPLIHRLEPAIGERLSKLNGELVWATTWLATANEIVAPRLGLPQLAVVSFPDDDPAPVNSLHWKTPALMSWAGGRPFVWLDDEITDADRRWVEDCYDGPALLHRVDPFTGLTDPDLVSVERWLHAVAPTG